MGLKFFEKIALSFQNIPRNKIKEIDYCISKFNESGIEVTKQQLIMHYYAGGDITKTADALVLAKNNKLDIEWNRLATINLAGFDTIETVNNCIPVNEIKFKTYSQESEELVTGFCVDGTKIKSEIKLYYRLTPDYVFGSRLGQVQERLSTSLSSYIHQSKDWITLNTLQSKFESKLLLLGSEILSGLRKVSITFTKEQDNH